MSNRNGTPDPVERTKPSLGWNDLVIGAGFAAVIAALVGMTWFAVVYGLRVRDGSGEVACAVTTCGPGVIAVCGLVFSLIPPIWCVLYAVAFKRLNVAGRVLGAVFTLMLLVMMFLYLPDSSRRRHREPLTTTEHGAMFAHGMGLGFLALFIDFIVVIPALMLLQAKLQKRIPTAVWVIALVAPAALCALAAATHP